MSFNSSSNFFAFFANPPNLNIAKKIGTKIQTKWPNPFEKLYPLVNVNELKETPRKLHVIEHKIRAKVSP